MEVDGGRLHTPSYPLGFFFLFLFAVFSSSFNLVMSRNKTTNDLKVLRHTLPPEYQEDFDIISGGPNPQHIVFTDIPYLDHNNNKKFIVSAVYSVVHKTLPPLLPTLLPRLQSPPAYEMRDIPGKGKGMIATRDIAFGEIVIIERPIIVSPRLMVDLDSVRGFQMYAERSMDQEDWIKFSDLVNVQDSISEFDGIRNTNAFKIDFQKGKEYYSGVFLELSRLNHSCGPNLRNLWNPHLVTFSVQAVRPIRAGQELTVSYINPFLPRADRQSALQSAYKFKCKCPYCKKPSPTSDQNRLETSMPSDDMSRHFELFYNNVIRQGLLPRHVGHQKSKMLLSELIGLLVTITKEGVESIAAPVCYVCLMKLSGVLGDKKKLQEWGFKAILSSVRYVETDGEKACWEVEQWIDWVKDPEKKFPEWGRYR